jgi:hypothetical protein
LLFSSTCFPPSIFHLSPHFSEHFRSTTLFFLLPGVSDPTRDSPKLTSKKKDGEEEEDDEETINFNGTLALARQLDINPTEDFGLLLIAWKLNCTTTFEFTLEEWMIGWSVQGYVEREGGGKREEDREGREDLRRTLRGE